MMVCRFRLVSFFLVLLARHLIEVIGLVSVGEVAPFHSGQSVEVSWECSGSTSVVRMTLCKGGPCSYSGGAADPYFVQNINGYGTCTAPAELTWASTHSLVTGTDYFFCVEDYSDSAVRACALANVTAGEIAVNRSDPFHAGQSVQLSWACVGPDFVRITLCKGGPCSYSGGSADPYFIQNIDGYSYCDHRAELTWSSSHALATGTDYYFCAEDYDAASVRGCTNANISAGTIVVQGGETVSGGESAELSWVCTGPAAVRVTLCKGGPCSYNGGAADPHFVQNVANYGYCDHRAALTWTPPHSLTPAEDYYFCVQDYDAPSVRGCSGHMSTTTTSTSSVQVWCAASAVEVLGEALPAPELPSGGVSTLSCPRGYAGKVVIKCEAGVLEILGAESTCSLGTLGCNATA